MPRRLLGASLLTYMGSDRAEEFGRRNAVPGEILVRVEPERILAEENVAGY